MNNVLNYKGYAARVEFDPRDGVFVGRVLGIVDGISFHGETVAELIAGFHQALDHYLEDCQATGRSPQRPASGKLMLRMPTEVHAAASVAAQAAGKSLNQWATEVLAVAAGVAAG